MVIGWLLLLHGVCEEVVELLGGVTVHGLSAVGVDIQCHTDIGVAEASLEGFGIDTGLRECRGAAVAKIMKADVLQIVLFNKSALFSC